MIFAHLSHFHSQVINILCCLSYNFVIHFRKKKCILIVDFTVLLVFNSYISIESVSMRVRVRVCVYVYVNQEVVTDMTEAERKTFHKEFQDKFLNCYNNNY